MNELKKNIAKLSSSRLVQSSSAELRFALILVITPTDPSPHPPPGKVFATSRPPRKLKNFMEALFNQPRSTS